MPGWKPLIICGTKALGECQYQHLIQLAQNIITDLTLLATLFAIAAFMFAGFKLMIARGNPDALKEAKQIFGKVVWGFVWVLIAWLLVYTITSALLNPQFRTIVG